MLTDTLGWRSIFFVNLPIGIAAFVAGVARLHESRDPAGGRADWVGTSLIVAALTALMFALIRRVTGWAGRVRRSWHCSRPPPCPLPRSSSPGSRVAAAPMADLRLFGARSFTATGFVAFAISATVIGTITYLSLYLQNTLRYSPVQAGLRLLPMFLASFMLAPPSDRSAHRQGARCACCWVRMAAAAAAWP